jgi:glucose-6-phosphate isomerase, archaeal
MDAQIKQAPVRIDMRTGNLIGQAVVTQKRTIGDLTGIFQNKKAHMAMNQMQLAYEVELFLPVEEGTPGGLYFGNTTIYPGKVGSEYIMTKGHFHANTNRNEYYLCIRGYGYLLFMNTQRESWVEKMTPGSLHYIGANLAHRVINTGSEPLTFLASWPADSGHDYESIQKNGFSLRIMEENNTAVFIKNE